MSIESSSITRPTISGLPTLPSPYQLHASDNPDVLIFPVILKEDNYSEWTAEFKKSLQAKRILGLIDGSISKPITDLDLSMWMGTNAMIVGRMRTSIDPKIRSTVSYVSNASELWENIRRRFSVNNGVRKQFLKDKISSCKQDGQPVLAYYGRLTKLWEELQDYIHTKTCSCEAAPYIVKEREDDRVHQFLFGLDERFRTIRSSITDQDPLPDVYQVYSRVIREEQNLNALRSLEVVKTDAIGFKVQVSSTPQAAAVTGPRYRDKSTLLCTHCNRQGHEVTECFLVHGYSEWWLEQNRGNGSIGSPNRGGSLSCGRGNSSRGGCTNCGHGRANAARTASPANTSDDQIAHLISLLQSQ